MDNVIFWMQLWATWDLRIMIILSLLLQIILIFTAPLRKRMSTPYIFIPMWAYLLADITANFAIGLISISQWSGRVKSDTFANPDLLAFWAPFLLVHLGGPDTITALGLEDNELWLWHFLGLGFQCWAVGYSFCLSFSNRNLWLPTVLIFIAGLIKYTERTCALYLASSCRFRNSLFTDPGPNDANLMDEYTYMLETKLSAKFEMIPKPSRVNDTSNEANWDKLSDLKVVQRAYRFFETFKGLIANLIFSFCERNLSREFFLKRSARDAFLVVEVELNFIYEILYTKMVVVQANLGWEKIIGLTNMLDGLKYVETVEFTTDLRDLIFDELKMKSGLANDLDTAKEIYKAKGDWVLHFEGCTALLRWVNEVDFDESLLQWHIATELCFNIDEASKVTDIEGGNARNSENGQKKDFCGFSKLLSDYMVYLLIMQSTMMSTVAGIGQIRFRDACTEAKKFFRGRKIEKGLHRLQEKACESILNVNTAVAPVSVKGDRSKSVLFDASMLAKELKNLEGERMWEVIFKVWVELLCYAACRCRAYTHAAQLSKGGELITLVWLLMTHLGLGNQFQISEGHAGAAMLVMK
ncbi:hypothetical protein U1Q18_032297 [Sarracenia purpurea var. burkii]